MERLDRALRAFEPESIITLLAAAVNSPGCGHRLPSLAALWTRAVSNPPTGTAVPGPSALLVLLDVAREAAPQLWDVEDCWLPDPRLLVRFPIYGKRLALHPGPFTNPLQILRMAMSVAEAIDPFVLDQHGFRLSDLVEAALAYSDRCLTTIRSGWPTHMLPRDAGDPENEDLETRIRRIATTPVVLNESEIEAASLRTPGEGWQSVCEVPSQAAAAWAWCTRSSDTLQLALTPNEQILGATFAVRTGSTERPVPVALVLSAIVAAVAQLSAEAAVDRAARYRLQKITEGRALALFDQHRGGSDQDSTLDSNLLGGSHDRLVAVALPDSRHAFVIGMASGLDTNGLKQAIELIHHEMEQFDTPRIHSLDHRFDPTGAVHRVIIYGGPVQLPAPAGRGAVWIHVDDLVDVAMEAHQTDAGREIGMNYVWQFLDEFSTMPGVERLVAFAFDDAWRHWLKYGVLNATGMTDVVLHPDPVPDQRHWVRGAAWEPIEAVLTSAGFPPSWEWFSAYLDREPGQATVGFFRHVCQVIAAPPLILCTPIDSTLSEIGVDPGIAFHLAGGVALTVVANPAVASVFTLPENTALVCHLIVQRPPLSTSSAEAARIGHAATSAPRPSVSVLIGPDWLELLARDPTAAHNLLGNALVSGLAQVTDLTEPAKRRFLAAWRSAPPVLLLQTRQSALSPRHQGRAQLPRGPATRGRARRILATAVLAREVTPGIYRGSEARRVCREQILPAANDALRNVLADWSPTAIDTIARHLNDAHAERARTEDELALALAAPWGAHWRSVALNDPEPSERTRPIELVLELLLARHTDGSVQPDRFDIAEAIDLAHEALEIGLVVAGAKSRLHDLDVNVESGGSVEVMPLPTSPPTSGSTDERANVAIDIAAYIEADRADRLRLRTGDDERKKPDVHLSANRDTEPQPFVPLRSMDVPGSLLKLDAVLKEACGTGFDGISAVLGTALTWNPGHDTAVEVNREDLRRQAIAWSGLPADEIDAALDHIVLEPAQLQSEQLRYWEQERRRYRLANRPLIAHQAGRLILVPWRIQATQHVYANYLLDGGIPWHVTDIPQRVQDALVRFRQVQNQSLERETSGIVAGLGLPHCTGIEAHHAAAFGLKLAGEIDLLVADPLHSRMWVCEVKDLSFAVSPATIAQRVGKFLGQKGYVSQLTRAADAVCGNPGAAARLVQAPDPDRDWRVIPLMVTRRVEPAGFAGGLSVSFVVLADLAATIKQAPLPPIGHVLVSGV